MKQSKSVRIAYLRRMLKRLEEEDARLHQLVLNGTLSPEEEELALLLLQTNRKELLSELEFLTG